jgi:putative transposase
MKLDMAVAEVAEIFKEIQKQPEQLFEMIRVDIRETVGQYLTAMMNRELTHYLGRGLYKRGIGQAEVNHRNGYRFDTRFPLIPTAYTQDAGGTFRRQ